MTWNQYTAGLTDAEHRRLVIAIGAALREVRQTSEVALSNGEVAEARRSVATALSLLADVRRLLGA